MTHPALIERITRSLAYMLRHQPEQFDLELDEYGYADIHEVVRALNERLGEPVEEEDVNEAIVSGDRARYEIRDGLVRALYGHSIDVKPGEPSKPPELLFVGVSGADAERASRYGLRPGRRRFLHLGLTPEEALETAQRTAREYTVITVHALDAWEEGINFYDRGALYLSDPIPTQYLELGQLHRDGHPDERFPRPDHDRGQRHERGGRRHGYGNSDAPPPRQHFTHAADAPQHDAEIDVGGHDGQRMSEEAELEAAPGEGSDTHAGAGRPEFGHGPQGGDRRPRGRGRRGGGGGRGAGQDRGAAQHGGGAPHAHGGGFAPQRPAVAREEHFEQRDSAPPRREPAHAERPPREDPRGAHPAHGPHGGHAAAPRHGGQQSGQQSGHDRGAPRENFGRPEGSGRGRPEHGGRDDRPRHDRPSREDRPAHDDRAPRTERAAQEPRGPSTRPAGADGGFGGGVANERGARAPARPAPPPPAAPPRRVERPLAREPRDDSGFGAGV